jgi:hypothetical protein
VLHTWYPLSQGNVLSRSARQAERPRVLIGPSHAERFRACRLHPASKLLRTQSRLRNISLQFNSIPYRELPREKDQIYSSSSSSPSSSSSLTSSPASRMRFLSLARFELSSSSRTSRSSCSFSVSFRRSSASSAVRRSAASCFSRATNWCVYEGQYKVEVG